MSDWFDWDPDKETLEDCRERRLARFPVLSPPQLEQLQHLRQALWDGYLISKEARSYLVKVGLAIKWNGWQVISREGLCLLETLGLLHDEKPLVRKP